LSLPQSAGGRASLSLSKHVNFANPVGDVARGNFGRATAIHGNSRTDVGCEIYVLTSDQLVIKKRRLPFYRNALLVSQIQAESFGEEFGLQRKRPEDRRVKAIIADEAILDFSVVEKRPASFAANRGAPTRNSPSSFWTHGGFSFILATSTTSLQRLLDCQPRHPRQ
jgi:hypothetical protein